MCDGRQVRDWLFVTDHCEAIRTVLDRGRVGETYNIGGDAEKQNIQVVHAICALLDQRRPRPDGKPHASQISYVADRPGHDRRYAVDASRLRDELGWAPKYSFERGIAETVDWYGQQAWVQRVLDGSYRLERIGARADRAQGLVLDGGRDPPVPDHPASESSCCRSTTSDDDLLPAQRVDAGGYPRRC